MKRSKPLVTRTPLRNKKPMKRSAAARTRRHANSTPVEIRKAVLARDVHCQALPLWPHACWGGLHVHHILPRGRGGKHEMDNLVVVCTLAHQYVHGNPAWARDSGLLR